MTLEAESPEAALYKEVEQSTGKDAGNADGSTANKQTQRGKRLRAVRRNLVARAAHKVWAFFRETAFSSLMRRILVLNLAALVVLAGGILYLNQFRAGLIDARVQSLLTQGKIIAGAIAASASVERDAITVDPDKLLSLEVGGPDGTILPNINELEFPIDPQSIAPVLRQLIIPTETRARIYDREGSLILDSEFLYSGGEILRFDLPPINAEPEPFWLRAWQQTKLWFERSNYPLYEERDALDGRGYPEVDRALRGSEASIVRVRESGEIIVSVAVPVQRFRAVFGALLLSTEGDDIDQIVQAERMAIIRVFLVAAGVTVMLSILLAGTIAAPLRRLAAAAEGVRHGIKSRKQIPVFDGRQDEIGDLSMALRQMTEALYTRMDAIGRFAADVSHELKNPLTSLRSAVETMPLAKNDDQRKKLLDIIEHDVQRLDRLITDISDASRLDAELAREHAEEVNVDQLLNSVISLSREIHSEQGLAIHLKVASAGKGRHHITMGNETRLGQVLHNLIDNAASFVPPKGGKIWVDAVQENGWLVLTVKDNGPGIQADAFEKVFKRFYTDRPIDQGFGRNSGLGLSISKQIIEAHGGTIEASNSENAAGGVTGALFTISLPAVVKS